jgi:hypothetical protein
MNWSQLANSHAGESCIVIGNGPSLNKIPLEFLNANTTLSSNRIYLLEGFKPDYYSCVNPLVLQQSIDDIMEMDATKFISNKFAHLVPGSLPLISAGQPIFSTMPDLYIYEGHTVTFVLLQLAYFLGFVRVGLVGVDHRYSFTGSPNQAVVSPGDDPNHFDPEYFGKGFEWHNPDLKRSHDAYIMARTVFEADDREIINLTPDSALDVFKRGEVATW